MSNPSLRNAQLQVLSRALAHLTHDVQNHLAIINESAGWIKDLMIHKNKQRLGKIGSFFKRGKQRAGLEPYLDRLNAIETYVNKASTITERLNSFSHGLEKNRSVFNAGKVMEEIQDVLIKQTGDKGIRLELKLTGEPLMIETDPSGFQLALFENVKQAVEGMERGECLLLETTLKDGQFQISLTGPLPGGFNRPLIENPVEKDHTYQ